jgi:hypothetical protein
MSGLAGSGFSERKQWQSIRVTLAIVITDGQPAIEVIFDTYFIGVEGPTFRGENDV